MPVFSLSDQKYIALEVTVSNLKGDDAYEAGVVATFPRTLSYSAYRVPENVRLSFCPSHTRTHGLHTLLTSWIFNSGCSVFA